MSTLTPGGLQQNPPQPLLARRHGLTVGELTPMSDLEQIEENFRSMLVPARDYAAQ